MAPPDEPVTSPRSQRRAKLLLAVALALAGLYVSLTFVPALLWAAVIAIAIDPLYQRAERRWPRRREAVLPAIATTLIALLVLAPLALAVVEAVREAGTVLGWVVQARANGLPEPTWLARLPFAAELSHWWHDNLATPDAAAQQFRRFRGSMLLQKSQLLGKGLIHRLVVFAFTLVALFFLLRDRDTFVVQLETAGERLLGASGRRIGAQLILSVRGTIDGLVLVGIGEGVAMTIVYVIAGVPHAMLLGLMTAVAAMIPFGAAVLFGIAALLLAGQGSVVAAAVLFVVGLVVVGIADHFVRPALIGGATRLPFLWVLIGILGGVETLGLLGLFVGPAIMATLIMLWREFVGEGVEAPAAGGSPHPLHRSP